MHAINSTILTKPIFTSSIQGYVCLNAFHPMPGIMIVTLQNHMFKHKNE